MPRTLILWIVAGSAPFSIYIAGQTPAVPAGPTVSIPFFASDTHDKAVSDVAPADVEVLDNKKPPQSALGIRGPSELPLRLGVLIDRSGSERTSEVYEVAAGGLLDFAGQLLSGADDKAFIGPFNDEGGGTVFVSKAQLRAVKVDLTPRGGTALYDELRYAYNQRMKKDDAQAYRRVIVLTSDGDDNASHIGREAAIATAEEAAVVIFAISTSEGAFSTHHSVRGEDTLKRFAEQTGGLAFLQLNRKDLSKVFATIKEQIDNMGVLSYVPASPLQNGQRRTLELKSASNRKLKFRAPKAYYLNAATQ